MIARGACVSTDRFSAPVSTRAHLPALCLLVVLRDATLAVAYSARLASKFYRNSAGQSHSNLISKSRCFPTTRGASVWSSPSTSTTPTASRTARPS
eukprot:5249685-Pyramimonas_sp.AAC.1